MIKLLFGFLTVIFLLPACSNIKNLNYFQGNLDSSVTNLSFQYPVIQKGDILHIGVTALDPQSAVEFNQLSAGSGMNAAASPASLGYVVDENGNIELPQLGIIKAEGLTRKQLGDLLKGKLTRYIKDPVVNVRFLDFKISVLGEVSKPGSFNILKERVTILDALSLAGDLTYYGKRNNVLLIRQNNEKLSFERIDLQDPTIFSKPFFWLQQNDVLYVEADPDKRRAYDQVTTRNISIATTILTTLAILFTALKR